VLRRFGLSTFFYVCFALSFATKMIRVGSIARVNAVADSMLFLCIIVSCSLLNDQKKKRVGKACKFGKLSKRPQKVGFWGVSLFLLAMGKHVASLSVVKKVFSGTYNEIVINKQLQDPSFSYIQIGVSNRTRRRDVADVGCHNRDPFHCLCFRRRYRSNASDA